MLLLDLADGIEGALVSGHVFHDTNTRDHRFVATQTDVEIPHHEHDQQHQQRQPEIRTPLCPRERIVLNILWREELVGMERIDIHRDHLQRSDASLIVFAVDFHRQGRNGIEMLVKRGDRVDFADLEFLATCGQGISVSDLHNLHTRDHHLALLQCRPLNGRASGHRDGKLQMGLFADENPHRVHILLYGDL